MGDRERATLYEYLKTSTKTNVEINDLFEKLNTQNHRPVRPSSVVSHIHSPIWICSFGLGSATIVISRPPSSNQMTSH